MANFDLMREIAVTSPSKIVMVVADGLGGLPRLPGGPTEIESARKPNLDRLAREGICGLTIPVATGVTPGSGPSHLALFGYDPVTYDIGRGVLEALGIDFDLGPRDLAARGNFCTVDDDGLITDRRAGRIATDRAAQLCYLLREITVPGVEVLVEPVKEHRLVVVFRGDDLQEELTTSDPQKVGAPPLLVEALNPNSAHTAALVNQWIGRATEVLRDKHPANLVLLRGFSKYPAIPTMREIYKLNPGAVAIYPMYRGLAKLVGMQVYAASGRFVDEVKQVAKLWDQHDFFFVHFKNTDSAGEDGDFDRKVAAVEELDEGIGELIRMDPDVLIITGDHSTPAVMAGHSWHPVPFAMRARLGRSDRATAFGETPCLDGVLGTFPAVDIMPLALAHAGKTTKFGA